MNTTVLRYKLAFFDARTVASDLASAASRRGPYGARAALATSGAVLRGEALARAVAQLASVGGRGISSVGSGLESLLAPAGAGAARALSGVGSFLSRHPGLAVPLAAAAVTSPIIMSDFPANYHANTDEILASRFDPERVATEPLSMPKLSEFLATKTASVPPSDIIARVGGLLAGLSAKGGRSHAPPSLGSSLATGMARSGGEELAKLLVHGAGGLYGAVRDAISTNPERKRLLERLLTTDPVISDAIKRNPATLEQVMEAYQTFVRYAPSLSVDVNALRSFLREAILGGGHVNYATIKNLIETEKSLHGSKPLYKGSF